MPARYAAVGSQRPAHVAVEPSGFGQGGGQLGQALGEAQKQHGHCERGDEHSAPTADAEPVIPPRDVARNRDGYPEGRDLEPMKRRPP